MDYKKIIKDYQNVILIMLGILIVFVFLLTKIIPSVITLTQNKKEITQTESLITDKQRQIENLKRQAQELAEAKENQREMDYTKPFYKPIEVGLDTESVIANEFSEILTIVRANSIKTKSIQYEYDPQDDNFVKGAPNDFNVARLKLEMIGTYKNFEKFLKELFKHEHFVDIESIEIIPYEKNKRILLINFNIKLYAQKS